MATHAAVATVGIKAPLQVIQVPTVNPTGEEVRVKVQWTASTPLDLHQNDGGLLVNHPQVLGDSTAGTVIELGPDVKRLKVGDLVFGFTWREQKEKSHQVFCTAPEWLFALVPEGFTMAEAVTLANNFVTVFHTLTTDLGIQTPWPKPEGYTPQDSQEAILIWGGASSVGQYAIQILRYYGYTNIFTTSSLNHHDKLRSMGAEWTLDYKDPDIVARILDAGESQNITRGKPVIPYVLDCIGSKTRSIKPISEIAMEGSKVAVLLPVIVRESAEGVGPEYSMDVEKEAGWNKGVAVSGVRTHSYLDNEFFKHNLQPDIMHTMLKERIVEPNSQRIIEGKTMLERAQAAMDTLRRKEARGERLVWRVAED